MLDVPTAPALVVPLGTAVNGPHLRTVHRQVIDVLRRHRPARMDLDFSRSVAIDAAGMRGLRLCRADAAQLDCRLVLVRTSLLIRSLLEAAGLGAQIDVATATPAAS